MDRDNLQVHDLRLTRDYAQNCSLYVEMGADGLSYLVVNAQKEVLAFKCWRFNNAELESPDSEMQLRQILASEMPLSFLYARVTCNLFTPRATLVPARLFHTDNLQKYFQLLLHPGDHQYACDILSELDCSLAYVQEPALGRLCDYYFPEAFVQHQVSPLLSVWARQTRQDDHDVLVHFRSRFIQVVVFDRDKLQFYNTFMIQSASDALYFIMLAFDQFRLDPLVTPLTLSGSILKDSEIFKMIARFVSHIRLSERPGGPYRFPADTAEIPPHFGHELFAAADRR